MTITYITVPPDSGSNISAISGTFSSYIALGTNPATAGSIRLPSGFDVRQRNAANSADLLVVSSDGADGIQIGGPNTQLVKLMCDSSRTMTWDNGTLSFTNSPAGGIEINAGSDSSQLSFILKGMRNTAANGSGGHSHVRGGGGSGTGISGEVRLQRTNTDNTTHTTVFAVGEVAGASALGFYGATVAVKPAVTGSKGANAALTSLLTALATLGIITDSSS